MKKGNPHIPHVSVLRPVSRSSFLLLIINLHHDAKAAARLGSAFTLKFSHACECEEAEASHEKSGTAATPTRRQEQECAFLNCFSCRRSNLSSSKSITRYRKFCSGAVSSPVIVCVNDRPFICNVSAYASDCGRLLISSFTVVKHVLLLVEPFLA